MVYSLLTSTWARLPDWLDRLEKDCGDTKLAMKHALTQVKHWSDKHPFGSCTSRSLRALGVFLRALDEKVDGAWEKLPEGVRHAIERVEQEEA